MENITWFSVRELNSRNKRAKKLIIIVSLFVFFGFCSNSVAQISVTLNQLKAIFTPGQTHNYTHAEASQGSVNIGKTAGSNVYDFSNVQLAPYQSSNNYYVSSVPNMVSRYPSNAVTIGDSPSTIERNPVLFFRQDTMFVLGRATVTSPQEYEHNIPYQVFGKFPLTYGVTFSQTFTVYDTLFNLSGDIDSSNYSYSETDINTIDGFGTLKISGFQFECLRIKLDHTNMGDKEFMYMTREGIFVDVSVSSTEADTGNVQIKYMNVMLAPNLTDVKDIQTVIPKNYKLNQNYPNPFNPTTTISYSIPKASFVSLKVYDVLGHEVANLVNEKKAVGNYNIDFNAGKLASGIYLYTMQAENFVKTKKLILLK